MSVQPIDIGKVTFKLVFHNTNQAYWIDPPIGWDAMPLELKRGEKYSRRIMFGEEQELEFWKHKPIDLGHRFDELIQYHKLFADESNIDLEIYVDYELFLTAQLDSTMVITDRESFYKTKLIVNDLNKKIEDLEDTKIDIFGDTDLNGNYNEPAFVEEVILNPKKILERATHIIGDEDLEPMIAPIVIDIGRPNITVGETLDMGNPYGLVTVDESDVAFSYYVPTDQSYVNTGGNNVPDTYITGNLSQTHNLYFEAETEVIFKIEDVHIKVEGQNISEIGTLIRFQAAIITYDNADLENVVNKEYFIFSETQGKEVVINMQHTMTLPRYTRVIYEYRVYITGRVATPDEKITIFSGAKITSDTVGIYRATLAKMTRLINAGKKILSNYTENMALIEAPKFFESGEFWWYYITSGYFIRGFSDESFDLSFKDWKEFIQNAFNCDVQISGNNVFIGRHEDFYEDLEVARFEFKPDLDGYEISMNPDLIINKLDIGYSEFEDDEINTLDAFHTESEWYIPKRNKGDLSITMDFIADGYSIEYARREGIEAEPTTSKSKDDDVYIVDCLVKTVYIPPIPFITEGGYFDFLMNRQNEGFPVVENIFSPESIYNLRLSLKRLLLDHYAYRISEIGQKLNNGIPTNDTVFMKNTYFKSNGELITDADSSVQTVQFPIKENEDVILTQIKQPLISPEIYTFTLSMRLKFDQLIKMYKDIINKRGYVTMFTGTDEIKFYPFDMSYDWVKEQLTFKAERKYEI